MNKLRLVFVNGTLQREGSDYYWESNAIVWIVDPPKKGSFIDILVLPEGAQIHHSMQMS